MAILRKIIALLLPLTLVACEEVFTPDIDVRPVLCVNALVTAGEPVNVDVSKSHLYTDTASAAASVSDASVSIYANDRLQDGSYIPSEGDDVRIVVRSEALGEAYANVVVPRAVPVADLSWEILDAVSVRFDDSDRTDVYFKLRVDLTLSDPEGDNYYRFTYRTASVPGSDCQLSADGLLTDFEPIFSEHIGIFESIMGGDTEGFTFFTDRQFAGGNYTLHLLFDNCSLSYTSPESARALLLLTLHSVSASYYNRANYVWQRSFGTLTDLADYGFGDPIWGYSNVSTGAGVVAAQSSAVSALPLSAEDM